jgi:hypothetical protein
MANYLIILLCGLQIHTNVLANNLSSFNLDSSKIVVPKVEPKKDVYEVLDSLFTTQLNIRELTGKNDGPQVEAFLRSVNRVKGDAWCAAYTSYNLQYLAKRGYKVDYIVSGWSPSWANNKFVIWKKGKPLVPFTMGDVFSIYFANLKRPAHVGFIYEDKGNTVITQEGNTSDDNYGQATREGNKVARKRRLKSQLYTVARFM